MDVASGKTRFATPRYFFLNVGNPVGDGGWNRRHSGVSHRVFEELIHAAS